MTAGFPAKSGGLPLLLLCYNNIYGNGQLPSSYGS